MMLDNKMLGTKAMGNLKQFDFTIMLNDFGILVLTLICL